MTWGEEVTIIVVVIIIIIILIIILRVIIINLIIIMICKRAEKELLTVGNFASQDSDSHELVAEKEQGGS